MFLIHPQRWSSRLCVSLLCLYSWCWRQLYCSQGLLPLCSGGWMIVTASDIPFYYYDSVNDRTVLKDRFHYQVSQHQDEQEIEQPPPRPYTIPLRNMHYERHLQEGNEPIIIRDTYHYDEVHEISRNHRNIPYLCVNLRDHCDTYAQPPYNGCQEDPLYMYHHCPVSCQVCPHETSDKTSTNQEEEADDDEDSDTEDGTEDGTNEKRRNHVLHATTSQYVPIRFHIPLHETFGIQEFNPFAASVINANRPEQPVLPINGLFIHSILSDGRNIQDQIPPQRATIITTATAPDNDDDTTTATMSIYLKYQRIIEEKIRRVNRYLTEVVDVERQYQLVRDRCRTVIRHSDCAIWSVPSVNEIDHNYLNRYDNKNINSNSSENEDDATPTNNNTTNRCRDDWEFMKSHGCYAFCYKCEYLHIESVCPVDINEKNSLYPGDVDALFTNIVQNFNDTYDITVLSRPYVATNDNNNNDDENTEKDVDAPNQDDGTNIDGPWIVQLDNFLTPEEANTMIELGTNIGYKRSNQVGDLDEFGKNTDYSSNHRTSRNAWCDTYECIDHEVVQRLFERIYNLTWIESDHSESIQLLQYTPGQYYRTHNDYIDDERHRQQGVRILTIFAYLNTLPDYIPTEDEIKTESDEEEEEEDYVDMDTTTDGTKRRKFTLEQFRNNGGTNFPLLNVTVRPKLGRVIIWTNVLNDYPNYIEDRTDHQALVVTHGTKYGANFWFHQRAFTCEEED